MGFDESKERLVSGNKEFVAKADKMLMSELAKGQHPFAAIVTCSDSRVPPEIIFSCKPGEIFVIRNAGNVLDDTDALASVEYAVAHLHVPLVVIMGHQFCGAVTAACGGHKEEGFIGKLMGSIETSGKDVPASIRANIKFQINRLMDKSAVVRSAVVRGKTKIIGAFYNLETGIVEFVD